jgi:HK97 family phage major capsid protein
MPIRPQSELPAANNHNIIKENFHMKKFKCEKCNHSAEDKGFCPVDGSQLVEMNQADALKSLLDNVGAVVEERTKATLKEMGFGKAPEAGIVPKDANFGDKIAFTKSILNEVDTKTHDALPVAKQEDFLKKAKVAYFFKHLVAFAIDKDPEHLKVVKALAEGTDGAGGYLTPTEFRAQLVEDLQDEPILRNLVTVIPVGSNSGELPTLASGVKTSWGSENTSISTTTARFGTLTYSISRLNTLLYTSRELVADSAIGIVQLITRLFIEAIGREEDRVIINGSGSGQPKGILQETLTGIDNANVDANLAPNIKKLPYKLGQAYRRSARWLVNSTSLGAISAIQDTTTGQFLLRAGLEAGDPPTLVGYKLHEQNDVPLDTLIFADLKQYYLFDREQISVESTTEGAGTFEKHQVAIKVTERIDGKVALTNAFRTLTNAGID